jgi:predicted amidohydrolase YtcJ
MTPRTCCASIRQACLLAVLISLGSGCRHDPARAGPAGPADSIYILGDIVTVNDAKPFTATLAIKNGKTFAVGTPANLGAYKGPATNVEDLTDGTRRVYELGPRFGANLLAPPDGEVRDIDDLILKLQAVSKDPDVHRTGWIIGVGYDDATLAEKRHPTRDDLDLVSKDIPVLAVHVSGGFSAVNSAGLKKLGYTGAGLDSKDMIRRQPGSFESFEFLEALAANSR